MNIPQTNETTHSKPTLIEEAAFAEDWVTEVEGNIEVIGGVDIILRDSDADRADTGMIDKREVGHIVHISSTPIGSRNIA